MRRRQVLRLCAGAGATTLAGCIEGGTEAGGTPTETETATATTVHTSPGTSPGAQGRIEYTVTNDDDESHQIRTTVTTAGGTVVKETTKSLAAGESVTVTSTGNDPERSPYELTVSLPSQSLTVELKLDECPSYNVGLSVTSDGSLSVEREVCQK